MQSTLANPAMHSRLLSSVRSDPFRLCSPGSALALGFTSQRLSEASLANRLVIILPRKGFKAGRDIFCLLLLLIAQNIFLLAVLTFICSSTFWKKKKNE